MLNMQQVLYICNWHVSAKSSLKFSRRTFLTNSHCIYSRVKELGFYKLLDYCTEQTP